MSSSSPQTKQTRHPERSEGSQRRDLLKTDPLNRAAAVDLLQHAPLSELLSAATALRAKGKGTTVTFSKKVFIPLTTLCRDYCGYCTFRNS
jgi:2-iminoacetate synthase ThiH